MITNQTFLDATLAQTIPQKIVFFGRIFVDVDYKLAPGSIIIFFSETNISRFRVGDGIKFEVDGSYLYGTALVGQIVIRSKWEINLENNAKIISNNSEFYNLNQISGLSGPSGVPAAPKEITFKGNKFFNNNTFLNQLDLANITSNVEIENNQFTCSNLSMDINICVNVSNVPITKYINIKGNTFNSYSNAAVNFTNCKNVLISNQNKFNENRIAISLEGSTGVIDGNYIENLISGRACLFNSSNISLKNNIIINNVSLESSVTNNYVVMSLENNNNSFVMENNNITKTKKGSCVLFAGVNSFMDINKNTITTQSGGILELSTSGNKSIRHNTINMTGNSGSPSAISVTKANVYLNTINSSHNDTPYLITASLCNNTIIHYNSIKGAGQLSNESTGIHLEVSPFTIVSCNSSRLSGRGISFLGSSNPSDISGNTSGQNGYGLYFGQFSITGHQLNRENRWPGTCSILEVGQDPNFDPTLSRFRVHTNTGDFWPSNNPPNFYLGGTPPNSKNPVCQDQLVGPIPNTPAPFPPEINTETFKVLSEDQKQLILVCGGNNALWENDAIIHDQVFNILIQIYVYPELLNDPNTSTFFNNLNGTSIQQLAFAYYQMTYGMDSYYSYPENSDELGLLSKLQSDLDEPNTSIQSNTLSSLSNILVNPLAISQNNNQLQNIQTLLDAIQPQNVVCNNLKKALLIYLTAQTDINLLTSSDKLFLSTHASNCYVDFGRSVIIARKLYSPDHISDEGCSPTLKNRNIFRNRFDVELHPNPVSNSISVEILDYNNLVSTNVKYSIFNNFGSEVKTGMLSSGNSTLDIDYLQNGVYVLKIQALDKSTENIVTLNKKFIKL